MSENFHDISKYYSASIVGNVLTIGKIIYAEEAYDFVSSKLSGPFELVAPDSDITRLVSVCGEVHPQSSLQNILELEVNSCLFLSENETSSEIEVRTIHKGIGTSIYSRQQCPLILWNTKYRDHQYFDVIDIRNVFEQAKQREEFVALLAESLRGDELFPPLMKLKSPLIEQ